MKTAKIQQIYQIISKHEIYQIAPCKYMTPHIYLGDDDENELSQTYEHGAVIRCKAKEAQEHGWINLAHIHPDSYSAVAYAFEQISLSLEEILDD